MQLVSAAFALPRSTSICICGGGGWGGCSVCASASLRVYRVGAREEGRGRGWWHLSSDFPRVGRRLAGLLEDAQCERGWHRAPPPSAAGQAASLSCAGRSRRERPLFVLGLGRRRRPDEAGIAQLERHRSRPSSGSTAAAAGGT
jgi:hypothetical protein